MDGEAHSRYRAIFISDVHLGTRAAHTAELIDFLRVHDADTIYLVGDIVDFWQLARRRHWPQAHNDVIQKLLRKARKGSRVVLIPGNHDEALDEYCGAQFGGVEIANEAIHTTTDGRRLLVIHGDDFDGIVRYARWLTALGDRSYDLAQWSNRMVNHVRNAMGLEHWSLSAYLKLNFKQAVQFIADFETAVAAEARRRGVDGVVCGHIHHAADKRVGGIRYLNCGDWVESCTALVEAHDGQIRLVRWLEAARKPSSALAYPADRDLAQEPA